MQSDRRLVIAPPLEEAPHGRTAVRVSGRELGGAYCVCEMSTLPGDGVPLHTQTDEELYYVIEGSLEMEAEDSSFVASAGSVVVIPAGVRHQFRNSGDVPARALMIFRPAGFDEMLEELDEARSDGDLADEPRNAILAKWGVRLLDEEP